MEIFYHVELSFYFCNYSQELFQNEIKGTQNKLDNIANDEANLEAKIEKKKAELERNNKRLKSLQNVRPAFMDEFEKLEGDLKKLYEVYMEKFRNLTYLEQIVDAYDRQQQVKVEVGVLRLLNACIPVKLSGV